MLHPRAVLFPLGQLHDAVIVSFGEDEYENCDSVWQRTKHHIVSRGHSLWNTTAIGAGLDAKSAQVVARAEKL